jgi:hypothetical protein
MFVGVYKQFFPSPELDPPWLQRHWDMWPLFQLPWCVRLLHALAGTFSRRESSTHSMFQQHSVDMGQKALSTFHELYGNWWAPLLLILDGGSQVIVN